MNVITPGNFWSRSFQMLRQRNNVNSGGMLGHGVVVRLYHIAPKASINAQATC